MYGLPYGRYGRGEDGGGEGVEDPDDDATEDGDEEDAVPGGGEGLDPQPGGSLCWSACPGQAVDQVDLFSRGGDRGISMKSGSLGLSVGGCSGSGFPFS